MKPPKWFQLYLTLKFSSKKKSFEAFNDFGVINWNKWICHSPFFQHFEPFWVSFLMKEPQINTWMNTCWSHTHRHKYHRISSIPAGKAVSWCFLNHPRGQLVTHQFSKNRWVPSTADVVTVTLTKIIKSMN